MVICILKSCLQGIMVNISNRKLCFNSFNAHGFKFKICHSAGCILSKSLVYFETDLTADFHFSADKM